MAVSSVSNGRENGVTSLAAAKNNVGVPGKPLSFGKTVTERALFCLIVVVVWGIIAIPTVLYALPNNIEEVDDVLLQNYRREQAFLQGVGISVFTKEVLRLINLALAEYGNFSMFFASVISGCPPNFIPSINGSCIPDCFHFSLYEGVLHQTEDALLALGFVVSILCCLIVVISWISVKEMWGFPQVIPFYIATSAALSVFITSFFFVFGRRNAFCPSQSQSLIESLRMASAASNVQGSLLHYFSSAAFLWWLFCAINLYIGICHPLSLAAHHLFDASNSRLYIIESIISWTVPLILVIAVHIEDGYYATLGPDTVACTPGSRSLTYFSLILPLQLFLGCGLTLLLAVIFQLNHEINDPFLSSLERKKQTLLGIERRFVFLFISYPICIAIVLSTIIVQLRDVDNFSNSFQLFLLCLQAKLEKSECQTFLSSTFIEASICSQVAFIFYAICGLVVALASKHIRTFWMGLFRYFLPLTCKCSGMEGQYEVETQSDQHLSRRRETKTVLVRTGSCDSPSLSVKHAEQNYFVASRETTL